MEKTLKNNWLKTHMGDIFSYAGLLLCILVFSILSKGKLWSAYNIGVLIQQTCVYAILHSSLRCLCLLYIALWQQPHHYHYSYYHKCHNSLNIIPSLHFAPPHFYRKLY